MKQSFLELNRVVGVKCENPNPDTFYFDITTEKVLININDITLLRPAMIKDTGEKGTELFLHNSAVLVTEHYEAIKEIQQSFFKLEILSTKD